MNSSLSIKKITGNEIEPFVEVLAKLRIEVFREFPYLYDGTLEYERKYLKTYQKSADSIVLLVLAENDVIGASTGLPLVDETIEIQKPFLEQGYDPCKVFYCGESILKKNYRGKGLYSVFMDERENHAKKYGRYETICFCTVSRAVDHPLKPLNYFPLDPVWKKFGYKKHPELTTEYFWKDLNEKEESAKKMVFWLKNL